jgi:hypothetical protein
MFLESMFPLLFTVKENLKGHEKLVTETFSAFYINISAYFIFLKLLSFIYSDEY